MANTLVKIGILGEEDAFDVEDSQARFEAASANQKADQALGMFPVSIENGGTGATTINQARKKLDVHYDLELLLGTYEGRNLSVLFADEIAEFNNEAEWFNSRVVGNNLTGIRIFDYFDITLTDGKVFRYRCAAYDPYYGALDSEVTTHHMIMVPDSVWPNAVPWNTTATNQGTANDAHPYTSSNLHNWEINTFYNLLPTKWQSVISAHRCQLEERYSTSSSLTTSTKWSFANIGKIWSLSETEVYGENVWSTPGYSKGHDCHFATFFNLTKHRIRRDFYDTRKSWFLRNVFNGNSGNVCRVTETGGPNNIGAASTTVRPLPCFRVGV